jgi:alpha-L-arabinofuranosidase
MSRQSSSALTHKIKRPLITCVESLETRRLLSIAVDASQTIRSVNTDLLGVNIATWDGALTSSQTQQLVAAAGIQAFRIPGGSTADNFHFAVQGGNVGGYNSVGAMAEFVQSVNGVGVATVNYGTGSPQEGAAMLAYLNAPINDPAVDNVELGDGEQWNGTSWVQVDWHTVGFWANLRAAAPLATDDGLNFLRISHPAAFGFHYWEIGNEIYGSYETDKHGQTGDTLPMPAGDSPAPHDPATYISFCKQFADLAAQIDPTISIGIGVQDPGPDSGFVDPNWTADILSQSVAQGFMPGFLSDHVYPQGPGAESDAFLLGVGDTTTDSTNPYDWAQRAADYRTDLTNAFGAKASSVELLATELNSVYNNPGKQSTSIVNALFIDDSIGNLLLPGADGAAGYDGLWVWDLHNSELTGDNNSANLYGWREFGDYGMLGTGNTPAGAGVNEPYPDYYAEQIASKIIQSGGTVVSATDDTANDLDAFSVMEPNGDLDLMVINKNAPPGAAPNNTPDPGVTDQINIQGFTPGDQATIWQYGVTEDDTQAHTGKTALSNSTATLGLSLTGADFSYTFPDYSVTVIDMKSVVTAALSNGLLTVQGTINADKIHVVLSGGSIDVNSSGSLVDSFSPGQVTSIVVSAGTGADSILIGVGVPKADILGGAGADTISTSNGHDTLQGGAGADSLTAKGGHNQLDGGQGNDTLSAKAHANQLSGGPGDDVLIDQTSASRDTLLGGTGNDIAEGFASSDSESGIEQTVTSQDMFDLSGTSPLASSDVTFTPGSTPPADLSVPNVRADYGNASTTPYLSSNDSSLGNPLEISPSGSIALPGTFDITANGGQNTFAYTFDLSQQAITFSFISFDVMVDPTSATDADGGYGFFSVATRDQNYVYNNITGAGISGGFELGSGSSPVPTAGTWYHVTAELDSTDDSVRAITFEDYGGSAQNLTGNVILYIDNLQLGT